MRPATRPGVCKDRSGRGRTRRGGLLLATRIHLPEAAAASFRLDGVERALARRGVPVRVLTTTPPHGRTPDEPAPRDPRGVSVSRWPALRDAAGNLRGYAPYMSFDVPLLLRALLQPRPDIVLVEPPPTTGVVIRAVCALRRLPYVWYAPDVWSTATESTGAPGPVIAAVRAMESFAVRGASDVVAINQEVARAARALGARRVSVVPNGIDTSVFDADGPGPNPRERAEMGVTGPYFIYAGTASEWQGAEVFARALAIVRRTHPDVQLLYIGQGSAWDDIAQVARTIPAGPDGAPAVVQHGPLPAERAARWQRGAVACLVSITPGQGYDFAYPTKVLAALGCGTPVLYAGRGPVVDDLRAHDLGWVSEHDAESVAEAMRTALSERPATADLAARRARRLHTWVETHRSLRSTGDAVARVLRGAVLRARSGRRRVGRARRHLPGRLPAGSESGGE